MIDIERFQRACEAAKKKMIGNGVPVPMGRAQARAIREAL